jgi:hypothetical protein
VLRTSFYARRLLLAVAVRVQLLQIRHIFQRASSAALL